MVNPASFPTRRIEPEFLGPLSDRPLAETARRGGPDDLFPGAAAFLSARAQRRRREQWNAARPLAERLLKPGEHLLYLAPAMEVPSVMHFLALGAMAPAYHQVMLVFTEERLIEVLLSVRGRTAGTRMRSFPWASIASLKVGWGKLTLAPPAGRKRAWKLPLRGDRRLLTLLAARLKPRLLLEGAARAGAVPIHHCPRCGAVVAEHPRACDGCKTTFRSRRMAALLSLAFPGAGLWYAGHPLLATADFLGEAFLYAIFLMLLLQAGPGGIGVALGLGALLFVLTKAQSAHLSQILVARTRPESAAQRSGYTRFALVGGLASLLLVGGALPLAGAARPILDRDLDIAAEEDGQWHGSRDAADWGVFADDPTARSQWRNAQGLMLTVFAYPQGALADPGDFRSQFRETLGRQGTTIVSDDESLPAPFRGFRFVGVTTRKDGTRVALIHYFIVDREHHDLHQVLAASVEDEAPMVEGMVRDFLTHARWIAATAPKRPAAGSSVAG